jgi:tRNA uridine 5-carbamoylmethylation protein Kti12
VSEQNSTNVANTIDNEITGAINIHIDKLLDDIAIRIAREYETNNKKLTDCMGELYEEKRLKIEEINKKYDPDLKRLELLIDPCI